MDPRSVKPSITSADISTLVMAFYAQVRCDPRLGPIFEHHVGREDADWTPHLSKIESFWRNVMLRDRSYQGNPMQAHMRIPEIRGEDFAIWLDLFEITAFRVLPTAKAMAFSELARRIGRSLSMGLDVARSRENPPDLRGCGCPCGATA